MTFFVERIVQHRLMWLALVFSALPFAQPPVRSSTPTAWYRRSRVMELTGGNAKDSVVLTAIGTRADSLAITMTLFVSGAAAHTQRWTSADELYEDSDPRGANAKTARFMRTRLDTLLALVKRQPINPEQVEHMGDVALLKRLSPRPTHQVMISFGYENSLFLVWDRQSRRMRVFMECC